MYLCERGANLANEVISHTVPRTHSMLLPPPHHPLVPKYEFSDHKSINFTRKPYRQSVTFRTLGAELLEGCLPEQVFDIQGTILTVTEK